MTVSETLSRTIGKLRRAWHGPPPTFMGHELTDPQAIAQEICANGTDEEQVRQFLGMSLENRNINKVEMILALRTLMENGSEIAEKFRNTGIALGMGDYHDMGEDYTLAAIQYTIAYLHGQDPGFYHMATEIETRNRRPTHVTASPAAPQANTFAANRQRMRPRLGTSRRAGPPHGAAT